MMTESTAAEAFVELALGLVDADERVTEEGGVLSFQGVPFARFVKGTLEVHLPASRIADLATRNIAPERQGSWVIIRDQSLWPEMASEAQDFVGEPPVGRQS